MVNFIKKHLYYHATLASWFQLQTAVRFCHSTLVSCEHLWLLSYDLQAFPVSLQYESGFTDLLKLNFNSGVGRLFEADHIDDVKLPWDFLALN